MGILGGILGRYSWAHCRRCRFRQRNNRPVHIPLHKLRFRTRIQPCIFICISHARAQFICKTDFRKNTVFLYYHFCNIGIRKIAVSQKIWDNFPQNLVPGTDTDNSIHGKKIIEMLFAESYQAIVAVHEIGKNHIPVIIAIHIEHAEDRICLMVCQNGIN